MINYFYHELVFMNVLTFCVIFLDISCHFHGYTPPPGIDLEVNNVSLSKDVKMELFKNSKEITQIVYGRWAKMFTKGSLSHPSPLCY